MTNTQAVNHVLGIIYSRTYESLTDAQKSTTDEATKQLLALLNTTLTEGEQEATSGSYDAAETAGADLASYKAALATLRAAFPDPFAAP